MGVYVDGATWKKGSKGRKSYAHLVADTYEEMHEFAEKVGIKPHFFHKNTKYPHYDISGEQRDLALQLGASSITSRELVNICRRRDGQAQRTGT
jgi:hypothetical protein